MKAIVFNNYKEKFIEINKYLGCEVIEFECIKFNNGEGKVVLKGDISNQDIVIFLDFSAREEYIYRHKKREYSKDEYYIELRRVISCLDNAKSISLVLPNIYASRQNSNNKNESKDYEIFINDLINLGVNNIISFECHGSDKRVKSYSLASMFNHSEYDVVVSPDEGGVNRASEYSDVLKCETYHFKKIRDLTKFINGGNPIKDYRGSKYNFINKNVLIVDDILDSGATLINAIKMIKGANKVDVFIAYPLFNNGVKEFKKLVKNNKLNKIYISNLISFNKKLLKYDFIEVIDCSELVSDVVKEVIK